MSDCQCEPCREEDFRVDVYSGAYNGTVVTHIPTGMRESCDEHRSQIANRNTAMARIKERLDNR